MLPEVIAKINIFFNELFENFIHLKGKFIKLDLIILLKCRT